MSDNFLKENELNKILNTLLETNYGLFYRRKYAINENTPVKINGKSFGIIKNVLDTSFINTNIDEIHKIDNKGSYVININKYTIVLKKKLEKKDLELDNNTLLINFENKKIEKNNCFNSEQLLFNLSKHKYVPHIELVENIENIETSKIAKIKLNDPLVKFYGFNKGDICKIVYKSNKINNMNLLLNYRIII